MNGGYILVDCTNLDLIKGDTPQTISGIYDRVIEAMSVNKPMYAVNCNWDGKFISPIQVFAVPFDGYIIVTASTLQITITTQDVITIVSMVG